MVEVEPGELPNVAAGCSDGGLDSGGSKSCYSLHCTPTGNGGFGNRESGNRRRGDLGNSTTTEVGEPGFHEHEHGSGAGTGSGRRRNPDDLGTGTTSQTSSPKAEGTLLLRLLNFGDLLGLGRQGRAQRPMAHTRGCRVGRVNRIAARDHARHQRLTAPAARNEGKSQDVRETG